jgi:glycosyltransferase involved in cell wall biosynthesis
MTGPLPLAIFTICSNNYIPAARTLLNSVAVRHPEADLFVCLADEKLDIAGFYDPNWTVIEAASLPIQDFSSFSFRYDVMEMNTAVKPFMFQQLLNGLGYQIALYFDPDIELFQPLESVLGPLREGASFVLTPHLCSPSEEKDEPNDLVVMRSGIYNLGFLGVSRCPESRMVLGWWARRLRFQCITAIEEGIFVDQKFMDLVPGFAARAYISHDTTLNVAYWNLGQRLLEGPEGGWRVDGRKLTFFHYSGFDPRSPDKLSKHARRYDGAMSEPLLRITGEYSAQLFANGYGAVPDETYAYGKFASGTKIHPLVRDMFRKWHLSWGDDPFQSYEAFLHQRFPGAPTGASGHVVTNFMKYLHDRIPALHARLNLGNPQHVRELVTWYRTRAATDLGLDAAMISPDLARADPPRLAPAVWTKPDGAAKDVTVVGYLRTASGVGEVGRQTLRSLLAGGVAAEGCDVALNVFAARDDRSCAELLVDMSSAPVQIFNINADQLPQVVAHMVPRLRPGAVRINIPFWELSRYPDSWLPGLMEMDEIWAPSRFIAQALESRLGKKVMYMPVALELTPPAPMPRARFNLPEGRFLFFFAFDFLSFIERKNPHAAIAAFREAFPQRGQAGLVLKCMNGAMAPEKLARFRGLLADDPDIFLIDDTLSRSDTLALIASTDAIISLHRSEGLGLLIGEAMLLGKPVIATDYSASQDLLSEATGYPVKFRLVPVRDGEYPFAEGQIWAEPDIAHAAALMRALCRDPNQAAPLVRRARDHMREQFSYENVGRLQARRLADISALAGGRERQLMMR